MQLDEDLTLEKAMEISRRTDGVQQQQTSLPGETLGRREMCSMDRVMSNGKQFQKKEKSTQRDKPSEGARRE